MAETFHLAIVTPEKLAVDGPAEEMQIPARNGYLGVLPGHAPLKTALARVQARLEVAGKR